ncbi:hypothetical protein BJ878DRAFT_280442 [Calycina marina]|uniref:DUF6594 domain-containing protein n=1 Tax=Calycina marina TaxID=1763456 RepID=A0A9P7YV84_9HELO|nr:hypothetical protein BJ878DRAFT_280442 [Calycina marina]
MIVDESYPLGWPRFAAFLNSADNYAMFRRFGTAHCRVLLHLMADLEQLEKELDQLDESDSLNGELAQRLRSNVWKKGSCPKKKILLEQMRVKLGQYDDLLLKDCHLRGLPSPHNGDFWNVFSWMWACKPLEDGQNDFFFRYDDFVASKPTRSNVFESFVESILRRCPRMWIMHSQDQAENQADHDVRYYPRPVIVAIGKIIAVCVAVTILMTPVLVLYLTEVNSNGIAGIVLAFCLAFACLMSSFGGNVSTVFVATCTYCAVLVVFMGSVQNTSND